VRHLVPHQLLSVGVRARCAYSIIGKTASTRSSGSLSSAWLCDKWYGLRDLADCQEPFARPRPESETQIPSNVSGVASCASGFLCQRAGHGIAERVACAASLRACGHQNARAKAILTRASRRQRSEKLTRSAAPDRE
jgi:hypothetical protein